MVEEVGKTLKKSLLHFILVYFILIASRRLVYIFTLIIAKEIQQDPHRQHRFVAYHTRIFTFYFYILANVYYIVRLILANHTLRAHYLKRCVLKNRS